jgi:hypothetical protein
MTRWASDVSPERALPEYPRPTMVRRRWQNLNGLWDYAVRPKDAPAPAKYDGKILVPFPIESALSGVMRRLEPKQRLWYRRRFVVPPEWKAGRLLLHHDEDVQVYLNGVPAFREGSFLTSYDDVEMTADALASLKRGRNVLAVHCRQTTGGQYVDVGLVTLRAAGP